MYDYDEFKNQLDLPLLSTNIFGLQPMLVTAQCSQGIAAAFPSLNTSSMQLKPDSTNQIRLETIKLQIRHQSRAVW